MSKPTAIAAVTQVLNNIISNAFDGPTTAVLGGVQFQVVTVAPDRISAVGGDDKSRLNIFLYQILPNPGWRNVGLPMRDGGGDRTNRQPLALDLRYLITAYATDELQAQIMLGVAMQALHEIGVLTRDRIRNVFAAPGTPMLTLLASSGVDQQIEQIKLTPYAMSLDELSKIMSGFQDKFRASVAYEVSVLLIESSAPARSAPPVLTMQYPDVKLFMNPTIDAVDPQMIVPAAGAAVTLRGYDLFLPGVTTVLFGGAFEQTPDQDASTAQSLVVHVPGGLLAGINAVQVIQQVELGDAKTPHKGFQSNTAAMVVRPGVATKPGTSDYDISVSGLATSVNGVGLRDASIAVHLTPAVGKRQQATLLLNDAHPPSSGTARGYSFDAPSRDLPGQPDTVDTLTFSVTDVAAGDYLLRVRVDGAETTLDTDAQKRFAKPLVSLP